MVSMFVLSIQDFHYLFKWVIETKNFALLVPYDELLNDRSVVCKKLIIIVSPCNLLETGRLCKKSYSALFLETSEDRSDTIFVILKSSL